MKNYEVIRDTDIQKLITRVNAALKSGHVAVGGVSTTIITVPGKPPAKEVIFLQAVAEP